MNINITNDKFKRTTAVSNPNVIYLFSDNLDRTSVSKSKNIPNIDRTSWYYRLYGEYVVPRKSTAVVRGLNNAFPITTYKYADWTQWSDMDIVQFIDVIDEDFDRIESAIDSNKYVSISVYNERFGNDAISKLEYVAPKCYKYLKLKLTDLGIDNTSLGKSIKEEFNIQATEFILPEEIIGIKKSLY